MPIPINPLVAEVVGQLDENLREAFEERAGIIEFDAGYSRDYAECLALLNVLIKHPHCLTGLVAVEIEGQGGQSWLLTTDLDDLWRKLAEQGIQISHTQDVVRVIRKEFNAVVLLESFQWRCINHLMIGQGCSDLNLLGHDFCHVQRKY